MDSRRIAGISAVPIENIGMEEAGCMLYLGGAEPIRMEHGARGKSRAWHEESQCGTASCNRYGGSAVRAGVGV